VTKHSIYLFVFWWC